MTASMRPSASVIPYLAAAATGVQVGAALVASQAVVADVGAGRLGFLRYALAVVLLLPLAMRASGPRIARQDLPMVLLLGLGQFGTLIGLLNLAVLYTTSARVAVLFATLPIVTSIACWSLGREALSRRMMLSIALSVGGVVVLLGGDALSGDLARRDLIGLALTLAGTCVAAFCSVGYRDYLGRYGVVRISVIAMGASLLPLAVMGTMESSAAPPGAWPAHVYALIGFIGLSSAVGYLLWLYSLSRLPAQVATAFLALSPVTSVVLSTWLGQPPKPGLLVALALVATGLLMSIERKTP